MSLSFVCNGALSGTGSSGSSSELLGRLPKAASGSRALLSSLLPAAHFKPWSLESACSCHKCFACQSSIIRTFGCSSCIGSWWARRQIKSLFLRGALSSQGPELCHFSRSFALFEICPRTLKIEPFLQTLVPICFLTGIGIVTSIMTRLFLSYLASACLL